MPQINLFNFKQIPINNKLFYSTDIIEKDGVPFLSIQNDEKLCSNLREKFDFYELYTDSSSFTSIPLSKLMRSFQILENNKTGDFDSVLNLIKPRYAPYLESLEFMKRENKIGYHDLWYLFPKDQEVSFQRHQQTIAGKVLKTKYTKNGFEITLRTIKLIGNGRFISNKTTIEIDPYPDLNPIDKLPCVKLSESNKAAFNKRAQKVLQFASGTHYLDLNGKINITESWVGTQSIETKERVIVDVTLCENIPFSPISYLSSALIEFLSPEDHHLIDPHVWCFSLQRFKKWGEVCVDFLSPIVFNEKAFDLLVIDPKIKTLLTIILIHRSQSPFVDIVQNKGGGSLVLFSGPPGIGKTLTAEAICERLKKPLYVVSVAELGTSSENVEQNLERVLFLSKKMQALLLIDEADVFLEQRSTNSIERNAMIAVFLRLLEYHSGDVFLTSNRVDDFDPAIKSRINLHIQLPSLDQETRAQIWMNLLTTASNQVPFVPIDPKLISEFSRIELNGRDIKHIINHALIFHHHHVQTANGESVLTFDSFLRQALNLAQHLTKKQ